MKDITLYSVTGCRPCTQVKNYLKDKNIQYVHVEMPKRNDPNHAKINAELKEISGQTRVPVIVISGEVITGFNYKRMRKLLFDS